MAIKQEPSLVLKVRADFKARLKAISDHELRSETKVLEAALNLYFDQLSTKDRHVILALSKRGLVEKKKE